jgi:hypothetical protein
LIPTFATASVAFAARGLALTSTVVAIASVAATTAFASTLAASATSVVALATAVVLSVASVVVGFILTTFSSVVSVLLTGGTVSTLVGVGSGAVATGLLLTGRSLLAVFKLSVFLAGTLLTGRSGLAILGVFVLAGLTGRSRLSNSVFAFGFLVVFAGFSGRAGRFGSSLQLTALGGHFGLSWGSVRVEGLAGTALAVAVSLLGRVGVRSSAIDCFLGNLGLGLPRFAPGLFGIV